MIYLARTDLHASQENGGRHVDLQLRSPSTRHRSLVFGPSIVRKSAGTHACLHALPVAYTVNRLWYGRALVSLHTYPQSSVRITAARAKMKFVRDHAN